MDIFYLGSHERGWLARLDVPLMVAIHRLRDRKGPNAGQLPRRLPVARQPWALDSGGFNTLRVHGRWPWSAEQYAAEALRCQREIGRLAWAASMDWMCEPVMRHGGTAGGLHFVGTKRTVREHQALTIESYLTLRDLAPEVPWIPVVQGWALADYLRHLDDYAHAGIDLAAQPVVGLGSVCRRQATREIDRIVYALAGRGLRLHGFGVKTTGLLQYAPELVSADSLAWSSRARRRRTPLAGCQHGVNGQGSCANCPRFALAWRRKVLAQAEHPIPRQLELDLGAA